MILLPCKQGSSEWQKARLGIPTASGFDRIITPTTRKPSTQAETYRYELLAEWLIGVPCGTEAQGFMERGAKLEPQGRAWYEYERGVHVKQVGIILRDDRMVGASPDGLVGEDGGIEIKTPNAAGHVRNMVQGISGYSGYFCQLQGCMWLSGRAWWDLVSYHPDLPPVVARVERDEEFIEALDTQVGRFVDDLLRARRQMLERGITPAEKLMLPPSAVNEDPF